MSIDFDWLIIAAHAKGVMIHSAHDLVQDTTQGSLFNALH